MLRLKPGWLVALCAAALTVSAWLPWLTDRAGGRANAIGGTAGGFTELPARFGLGQLIVLLASTLIVAGAMSARGVADRLAAGSALGISLLLVVLTAFYHRNFVAAPVSAGYGMYVGGGAAVAAALCSMWTLFTAVVGGRPS